MIKLGKKARDVVTGQNGVVTWRHEHSSGYVEYTLSFGPASAHQDESVPESRLVEIDGGDGNEACHEGGLTAAGALDAIIEDLRNAGALLR